ncbi:thermonuclease family protein [Marininema halotolerans]|uniref:Endonuclease YncB, thermonuclease family n=1 Tax=Marininema halotolerans TaxID=1155944 RepID=A0A1I6UP48_9BACL|nr:thermonuclease family protein [Marininema halotolerans]SFT03124.1 Endonuclease YncB, thermonuclease family [Marininema halotolerans]
MRKQWSFIKGTRWLFICTLIVLWIAPTHAHAATYSSTIRSVVDGDTVHLNEPVLGSTKVRLLSMDAPETNYLGKSQGKYGEEAKIELKKLLPEGTPVTVETDQTVKDQYGRLLAYIHTDKLDINEEMVRLGYAIPYYIWPNMSHYKDYQSALQVAQNTGAGMWDPSDPLKEMPFEFRLRIGKRDPDKYVGNYETKKYVDPTQYNDVPIEQRVFFLKESDAKEAGYTREDGNGEQPNVLINEVLPNPESNTTKEFIELYNPSNQPMDLGGYIIDDIVQGGSSPHTIPEGTTLPAKGFFVWETFSYFNNNGDDVTLLAPDGKVIDSYHYRFSVKGASWARIPDGGEWGTAVVTTPTKGTKNQ